MRKFGAKPKFFPFSLLYCATTKSLGETKYLIVNPTLCSMFYLIKHWRSGSNLGGNLQDPSNLITPNLGNFHLANYLSKRM